MRLVLDEHLPPSLATQLSRHGMDAFALRDWQDGRFLQRPDHEILAAAQADDRVIVTYDRRTFPSLLKNWAEEERSHGGVIFVDNRTIAPDDIGSLLRALLETERRFGAERWQDRVVFLEKVL